MMPKIFSPAQLDEAIRLLKAGHLVAFPTETVYGLGADVTLPSAIEAVYLAKQRPHTHPVIIHIDDPHKVSQLCQNVPESYWVLAKAFWPGPLTMIMDKKESVSTLISGGHATVGVRIPHHPVTLNLLKAFDLGLIGPSANRFGQISPTTPEHVLRGLQDSIQGVIDGGPCEVGIESTVIYLQENQLQILRQGMVSADMIQAVLPSVPLVHDKTKVASPGTHKKHYAPHTKMQMIASQDLEPALKAYQVQGKKIVGFGTSNLPYANWTKMPENPESYAKHLYEVLHRLDSEQATLILCEHPPEGGLWGAILDRLERACFGSHNQS